MSNTVLQVENLSKQYRLGDVGTGTLSHDLNRWWHKVRSKEDPYLKVSETNDRTKKGSSNYVWALKDINFEVKRGEILGIIGKNGAGKSTLLKILSKVTAPTTGSVRAKGRIASLLEVGTGFHPELTGRENIYLNGAILGMTKAEIRAKLDEIVDFAGVEKYLDTPVKRYSSGMTVRLGFAVAAHLEPEILIVDEVLAVGDAEFQKKAIGKMQDVSKGDGRTVLFVSHNMSTIRNLCKRCCLLHHGRISQVDSVDAVIKSYIEDSSKDENINTIKDYLLTENIHLEYFNIDNNIVHTGKNLFFTLKINLVNSVNNLMAAALLIYNEFEERTGIVDLRPFLDKNGFGIKGQISSLPLVPGKYKIGLYIHTPIIQENFKSLLTFQVFEQEDNTLNKALVRYPRNVTGDVNFSFEIKKIKNESLV